MLMSNNIVCIDILYNYMPRTVLKFLQSPKVTASGHLFKNHALGRCGFLSHQIP